MSDALPLPPRPNLDQYKKLAKGCQRAWKSGDPSAFRDWAGGWVQTLARLRGSTLAPETQGEIDSDIGRLERQWRRMQQSNPRADRPTLADAQFLVARCHGFASWPKFVRHLEALAREHSPVSRFERAVDAMVTGDLATLDQLLSEDPALVRARSAREHRSTLLHYVSANGVEDFRQRTPGNIVEITKRLLAAGADVNAESEAYGGRSTALGLTATSWHPEKAGVQRALMGLLIDHGATIDGPEGGSVVNACLHNGRGDAAEFLAECGARLDLEGAAGVGRLEIVQSFYRDDGSLRPPATPEQMQYGFGWACEFGRTSVVDFQLLKGMDANAKLRHGETGLHWAAHGGHAGIVQRLLESGAAVDATDDRYSGTPLGWALHGWGNAGPREALPGRYYEAVARLVRAGATVDPQWYAEHKDHADAVRKIRSDPRMMAALGGQMPSE